MPKKCATSMGFFPSAFTMTINGLELGSPRISAIFKLSTSADGGFVPLVAPAIVSLTTTANSESSHVGAIAGGIVEGIVLIAIVSFLIVKKVRTGAAISESKPTPSQNALETEIPQMHGGADLPATLFFQQRIHQQKRVTAPHMDVVGCMVWHSFVVQCKWGNKFAIWVQERALSLSTVCQALYATKLFTHRINHASSLKSHFCNIFN